MKVGEYRHNYEYFYEKSTYIMFLNRERTITTQGVLMQALLEFSPFLFFSLGEKL